MTIKTQAEADRWTKPAQPQDQTEAGYDKWLVAEIAEGVAELDAGKGIPASEVWRDLELE